MSIKSTSFLHFSVETVKIHSFFVVSINSSIIAIIIMCFAVLLNLPQNGTVIVILVVWNFNLNETTDYEKFLKWKNLCLKSAVECYN